MENIACAIYISIFVNDMWNYIVECYFCDEKNSLHFLRFLAIIGELLCRQLSMFVLIELATLYGDGVNSIQVHVRQLKLAESVHYQAIIRQWLLTLQTQHEFSIRRFVVDNFCNDLRLLSSSATGITCAIRTGPVNDRGPHVVLRR